MTATLEILDVRLCITCDDESLIEPFLGGFSSFAVTAGDAAGGPPRSGAAAGQKQSEGSGRSANVVSHGWGSYRSENEPAAPS